jgi:hypothetical protein
MKAEETTPQASPVDAVDRSDLEATLAENGYSAGKADPDPEKDATHIWTASNNSKFVMFREPDDGTVIYGDAREAGVEIRYDNLLLMLMGLIDLAQAKKPVFSLPASVAKKLAAGRGLSDSSDSNALATTSSEPAEVPRALPRKKASPKNKGVFDAKNKGGRGGIF